MSGEISVPRTYIEMLESKKIICLANSVKKHPYRCLAGIDTETEQWIRPVSQRDSGELGEQHYETEQGHEPTPLDILRIYLEKPAPKPSQPENWTLGDQDWQIISQNPRPEHCHILSSALEPGPEILGNTGRAVSSGTKVDESLTLVRPKNAVILRKPRSNRGDQPRLKFELRDAEYNLPITDPRMKSEVFDKVDQAGSTPLDEHINHVPLITISLGEEFNSKHWKLVAAIFQISQSYV